MDNTPRRKGVFPERAIQKAESFNPAFFNMKGNYIVPSYALIYSSLISFISG